MLRCKETETETGDAGSQLIAEDQLRDAINGASGDVGGGEQLWSTTKVCGVEKLPSATRPSCVNKSTHGPRPQSFIS